MRKPQVFVIRFQKTIGGSRAATARLRESAAKHLPFLKNSTPSEIRWAMSGLPMISVRREISGEPLGNLIRLRQMPIDKRRLLTPSTVHLTFSGKLSALRPIPISPLRLLLKGAPFA